MDSSLLNFTGALSGKNRSLCMLCMSPRKGLTTVAGFTNLRLLFFFFFNKLLVFRQLYFTNISYYACMPDLHEDTRNSPVSVNIARVIWEMCPWVISSWFEHPRVRVYKQNGLVYQPSKLYGLVPRLATCKITFHPADPPSCLFMIQCLLTRSCEGLM